MYEVTQSERDMYKQTGSVKRGYIDIIPLSDTEETITLDEYDIKDFTILDDIYTPEQGIIGSIIAKQLTLNLFKPTDIDLTNREINVFIGVDILENGEWITKYIPFGTFIIQKPDSEEITNKTSFDAFDFMVKFNLPFEDTLTYPCTIKDVLNAICEQCGVELATTSFANENFVVENNQFVNGESCRDVLKAIAQISGSFARIGRDNKLYLGFLNPENYETFDDTDYNKDIKINNTFGPVNRLVLRMSQVEGENVVVQDDESISQIGIKELIISDNPFTYTQEKRENAITQIWNKVKGLTYIDYDMKVIPRPYMDVGDSVKILTQDNVQYNSYLFTHELNYTGGLSGNMTATADTETETKYAFIPQLSTRMRHTEIIVDKHTGQITQIVEEQGEYDTKLSQITQDIDSINQKLQNVIDFTRTQSGKGFLHLNDCVSGTGYIIELSIRDVNYLTPSETLTPSEYLVPFGDYFTLVVDKADKNNRTDEAFELRIDLDKSLLRLDDNTYDEILINDTGDINLIRRVGKDEQGILYKLEVEITENLGNVVLPTFESDTYIYVKENFNINFYTKWIIKSDFSDVYARKVELSSAITQTTTNIMSEVNRKVNDEDFGTKIIQDFESVQIAWNQISRYIKFENGALKIYNSINNNILLELNSEGMKIFDINGILQTVFNWIGENFYSDDGKYIGTIGIDNLKDESYKGLKFALEDNGSFMTWNKRVGTGTSDYAQVLSYHNNTSIFSDEGLLLGRNLYTKGFRIYLNNDKTIWTVAFSESKGAIATATTFSISYPNSDSSYSSIMKFNQSGMDGYTDLNMHGHSITNVSNWESDGRLKKNIKSSDVNALDEIMQIQHRQFDWKDSDEHNKIGYVAQEMQEIDENFVKKVFPNEKNQAEFILEINEKGLIPVVTKAIQEQQEQINTINRKLDFILENLNLQDEYNEKNQTPKKIKKVLSKEILDFGDIEFNRNFSEISVVEESKEIINRYDKNGKVEMFERSINNG